MSEIELAIARFTDFINFCEETKQDVDLSTDKLALQALREKAERDNAIAIASEIRIVENFLNRMPKAYRLRNANAAVICDILLSGTTHAGHTSCCEKCRELGINSDGHTLERMTSDGKIL